MTHRERILAAIRGEAVDRLPWVPRLDLWYKANVYCDTMPADWQGASLTQIQHDLGVGRHEVIPDFLDVEEPDEVYDRALGIDHVPNQPFRLRFRRTERIVERAGDETLVTYRTPVGSVSAKVVYTEQMRRDGVTLMQVTEKPVRSLDDYQVVAWIFEDLEVVRDGGRYDDFRAEVGESGVAVAYASACAGGAHHLLKELVPYDRFYFDMYDHPEVIERTAQRMQVYYDQVLKACAESPAELVMLGANYDLMVTPPPVFERYLAAPLAEAADRLHSARKLLATHTDGENQGLCEFYVQCRVDLADSVCPFPMTRLHLTEYRECFGVRPAIWGGICSVSVLEESLTEEQFETHLDEAIEAAGDGLGMVFSIADTTPPNASLDRIRRIGERLAESGPVAGPS